MWGDAGQKRQMLRMRQVFASTSDRESRISDDSDDRDPTFYNKQMLVEFDDKQVMEAFKVDADFPFGFDFLSKVDFCEINFGEKTEIGEKISIAGVETPRKGFALCRVCGKVQEDNKEPSHAFSCTARDQESDKNLIDCIYLYRQFVSEAIRILLPVSIISESDKKLHSFIAAIQLGLRMQFRGKIDHLQTTIHEEPLPDSAFKRKYLVLYDTVPGGTGYLKQLMRSEHQLMRVLEFALETLKSCTCNQDENKDGCYRCLFAYRNSYNMPETSRDTAIELLAEILSFRDKLVKTDNIDYGDRTKPLWDKAIALAQSELGLNDSFYREEWERIIQPFGITSFAEYRKARRIGRGVRLSRQSRKTIWPVFEEYRVLLNEHNLREVDDSMRDACALIKKKGDILPYRAVIVDEAQDMSVQAFKLIRQIVGEEQKNDLFIVGDAHQRIYRHKITLGHCGINIRGRGRKLRINYRTTEENRRWAVRLLEGISFDDLDGGQDDQRGYKSLLHGVIPKIEHLSSFQEEIEFVIQYLRQVKEEGGKLSEVCLVARTHDLLRQYEGALKAKGLDTYFIRRSEAEDRGKVGIRLATMHRVKGLEFDRVIIAGVNDGVVPLKVTNAETSDPIVKKESETRERALLYVAATRAKKEVIVTSFNIKSKYLLWH